MENLSVLFFYLFCFFTLFLFIVNAVFNNCIAFLSIKQKHQNILPIKEYSSHDNWKDYMFILDHAKEYIQLLTLIKSYLRITAFFCFFVVIHLKIRTDLWIYVVLIIAFLNLIWYLFDVKLPQKTPIINKAKLILTFAKKIKYLQGIFMRSLEIKSNYSYLLPSIKEDSASLKKPVEKFYNKNGLEQYLLPDSHVPLLSTGATFKELLQKVKITQSSVLFFYENESKEVSYSLDLELLDSEYSDAFSENWKENLVALEAVSQDTNFDQLLLQVSASVVRAVKVLDLNGCYLGIITLEYLMDLTSLGVINSSNIPKGALKKSTQENTYLEQNNEVIASDSDALQFTTLKNFQEDATLLLNTTKVCYTINGSFPMDKFLNLLPDDSKDIWQVYKHLDFYEFLQELRLTAINSGDQFTYAEVSFEIGLLDYKGRVQWAMVSF